MELRNILKEYDDDPAELTPFAMENCIDALMRHPLIRSIYSIAAELCKQHVQVIAPYYLFTILKHKSEDIFAPFRKKSYKWSNSKVKTEYEVMSTDETSAKKQRNSIFLFNALCSLAGMFMSFNNSNIKLCEFLFERCRGYVPHCRIEPTFSRSCEGETCNIELNTIVKSSLHQYPLQFSIAHNIRNTSQINVMNFQQYAQTQCTAEDFYHFFFHPNSAQNKVLKRLKELLTKEKVDEYAAIALYPADGYGTSHQTVKWHCQMAAFMDQIIDGRLHAALLAVVHPLHRQVKTSLGGELALQQRRQAAASRPGYRRGVGIGGCLQKHQPAAYHEECQQESPECACLDAGYHQQRPRPEEQQTQNYAASVAIAVDKQARGDGHQEVAQIGGHLDERRLGDADVHLVLQMLVEYIEYGARKSPQEEQ